MQLVALSSLGAILAPLNSTMVAVALPDIRHEFDLSRSAVAWLVSGYLIAMAVAQPIGGRLGDQIGRARVYRVGLLAFLALSIATPFSPNFAVLVVLRVAQAVAGAVLIPNGMAMLRMHAPPEQLGQVSGMNGAVLSFAAAVGPLLGAAVLAVGSWRWTFLLSVPVIIAALLLLQRMRLSDEDRRGPTPTPMNWTGSLLFAALLVAITAQLARIGDDESIALQALIWAGVAVGGLVFALQQSRTASPAAEWRLFRIPSFAAATAYTLLTNLTMYTTLLMMPFFVKDVLQRGTAVSGVLLGAMSILVAITSPFGGRLSDAWGRRPSAQLGAALMVGGSLALLLGLSETVPLAYLAGCLAVLGLGLGLGVGAAQTAALESVPRAMAGSASGTSSMMRYVGSIVGAGLMAGVLSGGASDDVTTFRLVLVAVSVTAGLSIVSSFFIHRFVAPEIVLLDERGRGRLTGEALP